MTFGKKCILTKYKLSIVLQGMVNFFFQTTCDFERLRKFSILRREIWFECKVWTLKKNLGWREKSIHHLGREKEELKSECVSDMSKEKGAGEEGKEIDGG